LATKATEFGEITLNSGYYVILARSPILVQIKNPYATSY